MVKGVTNVRIKKCYLNRLKYDILDCCYSKNIFDLVTSMTNYNQFIKLSKIMRSNPGLPNFKPKACHNVHIFYKANEKSINGLI
jgi:hypothetical protein